MLILLNLTYLFVILFIIGFITALLARKNIIIMLIALEVMLIASVIIFSTTSLYFDSIWGQIIGILVLTVAATETALGLALMVAYFKLREVIFIDFVSTIKG